MVHEGSSRDSDLSPERIESMNFAVNYILKKVEGEIRKIEFVEMGMSKFSNAQTDIPLYEVASFSRDYIRERLLPMLRGDDPSWLLREEIRPKVDKLTYALRHHNSLYRRLLREGR